MITIVRLKEYNPRQNHVMRSYTSSFGNLYREGHKGYRRVNNLAEVNELRGFPQFEIQQFQTQDQLDAFLDGEAQKTYARQGVATKPPVTPVQGTEKLGREYDDAKKARIANVLGHSTAPAPVGVSSPMELSTKPAVEEPAKEEVEPEASKPQAKKPTAKKPARRKVKRK